jgi:hypothetical protein
MQLEHEKKTLKMKSENYSDNVLKSMVIEATKDIYKHLNISEMKVVNVGGGAGSGHQDAAGQLMA